MVPTVLIGVGPRKKWTAWRGAVAEGDHDGSGAVSVQISDREALLTSYVPATPDGVE